MDGNRKDFLIKKILPIVLCLALLAVFVGFLIWNRISESEESRQLQQMAEEHVEAFAPIEEPVIAAPEEEMEEQDTTEEPAAVQAEGIACWGDEFFRGEEADKYSYRVTLQNLLEENGYDLTVTNKTLSGASTLSMMKMAGVAQADLDSYIETHREAANGADLPVTETGIRDLTDDQMERTEVNDIPVLFMGYYGGWNHDLQELIEQEQKILNTFGDNKENYIIIGLRPMDGSVERAAYDAAMTTAWGEHYISAAEVTTQNAATRTGQEEIGQAVYEKLIELKYITAGQE